MEAMSSKEKTQIKKIISRKLNQMFSKDKLYENSFYVYRMNKNLEFPATLLFDDLKTITDDKQLIKNCFKITEFINFNQKTNKIRLHYHKSDRIVIVTGIKKEYVDQYLKSFLNQPRYQLKKPSISYSFNSYKIQIQTESNTIAKQLKKYFREGKQNNDYNGINHYKLNNTTKVRIIIESQQLYTLLLDYQFEIAHKNFILNFVNVDSDIVYSAHQLTQNFNGGYIEDHKKQEQQEDFYSQDKTSKGSSNKQKIFYKELIQTNERGTQLNGGITIDQQNQNSMIRNRINSKNNRDSMQITDAVKIQTPNNLQVNQMQTSQNRSQIMIENLKDQMQLQVGNKISNHHIQSTKQIILQNFEISDLKKTLSDIDRIVQYQKKQQENEQKKEQNQIINKQTENIYNNVYPYQFIKELYNKMQEKEIQRPICLSEKLEITIENQHKKNFFNILWTKMRKSKRNKNKLNQSS